jgi:arachidonate 15-lipoxygenase
MLSLSDVIDELFMCLGPLRACEEPIQDRCVDPAQEYLIGPVQNECVDPVLRFLEVNPLGFLPGCGPQPSLPQFDTTSQQDARDAQLGRTRPNYQYNYTLVRTFRVEERNGNKVGVQGRGIAILDSLPFSELPSLCWIIVVLRQALIVLDNLLMVLELLEQPTRQKTPVVNQEKAEALSGAAIHEADITSVTQDDVSPQELERKREDVEQLRNNLLGTLIWTQKIAARVQGTDNPVQNAQPLRASVPAQEARPSGVLGSVCPCPRCSPQAITREIFEDIKHALASIVERMLQIPELDRHPMSIRAYNDLFQRIPLPQFALTFRSDEIFALQRVAGQNPLVLQRVEWTKAWAKKFPVTPEQYTQVMGKDDSLESAGQEGRLYVCDYGESLDNTIGGDFPPFAGQKYINAPLALFALSKADRNIIKAVAIQAGQEPGPDNPVITPDGGWNWEIAKTIVQNAECNDSEYYRHLGLGHLLTEAFILATHRQLSKKHPLYVLLTPHFEGTLATNSTAVISINDEGSYLNITEAIFSCTVPATLGIAANAVNGVNFTENMLANQLRRRGVDDPKLLPNYPYRDDALLIWNAIHVWVTDYVRLYYTSDRDVVGDYELQNWVTEVSSRQGGRIKGVGDVGGGGKIETLDYLIDCVTEVIYTASAHHALTNFPLDDYELYAPGWPGALYQKARTEAQGAATRKDWLEYLSPLNIALLQQALGFVIGSVYYTELGHYPLCHFADGRVRFPLMAFQEELRRIEEIIRERNMTRLLRYPYLLPSRIPQSTNI